MQPRDSATLIRVLIGLQVAAIVTLVGSTFAAVVVDIPLWPAMLLLAGVGLLTSLTATAHPAVRLFGLSAVVFALFYYVCLYALGLALSPLYLAVLAYAAASFACAVWLLFQLGRRA